MSWSKQNRVTLGCIGFVGVLIVIILWVVSGKASAQPAAPLTIETVTVQPYEDCASLSNPPAGATNLRVRLTTVAADWVFGLESGHPYGVTTNYAYELAYTYQIRLECGTLTAANDYQDQLVASGTQSLGAFDGTIDFQGASGFAINGYSLINHNRDVYITWDALCGPPAEVCVNRQWDATWTSIGTGAVMGGYDRSEFTFEVEWQ